MRATLHLFDSTRSESAVKRHSTIKDILRAVTNCGFAPLRVFQNLTAKPAKCAKKMLFLCVLGGTLKAQFIPVFSIRRLKDDASFLCVPL